MTDIHPEAQTGFTQSADRYVSGRPGYPAEIDGWLRETMALGPGRTVLDLGAGTGKFSAHLAGTGAAVIAVEPLDAMRERLTVLLPDIDARTGSATDIPLADESVDTVICAQAFHWFATADALREIRRVLKPGGALGLVWNVRDASVSWVGALSRLIEPFDGNTPRFLDGEWRAVFPADGFGPLEETDFAHVHIGPPERVIVDRVLSISFLAALPAAVQSELATDLRLLIDNTPDLAGRDEIAFPYRTLAVRIPKTGA